MFNTNQPWYLRTPRRLRFVDAGADTGGTDGQHGRQPATGDNNGENVDWKSKFETERAHSREWEKRAKDNKAAADELQQLKESQMSEQQKNEARTAKLQKELDALKAEKQSNEWRSQVAEESGLPANLIVGDSLEAMQAHAKAINEYASAKTGRQLPKVADPGRRPQAAPNDLLQYAAEVFSN
ncbi:DUF4355 domain-containing protein [Bifidobacterium sp. 82T10]|uniref:DUF4355 domain-containing protein n=1 Tax=Bifidobacterium miconis TaxID=2834435 RepID=A0ABS6WGP2_9BIFI|nr:DUF4355 domain-containing protein [Bifidobacterium miconis]MBW3093107.1 DUF4355 domain-containing protein [Bifidobacterium miconis]